jgi:hypothetical protein
MLGSICHLRRLTTGSRNVHLGGKRFADNEEVEIEVWECLKQQTKDLYAAGRTGKQWDKCINVGGRYVEK